MDFGASQSLNTLNSKINSTCQQTVFLVSNIDLKVVRNRQDTAYALSILVSRCQFKLVRGHISPISLSKEGPESLEAGETDR